MRRALLVICTLVAAVATVGSLYFSEVMGLFPCELCWYQRILMYPLVVVLGVAAYENRPGVWKSALPLSTLGVAVAAYHSYIQWTPTDTATCTIGGGCGSVDWQWLWFTIPRLSLLAFSLLTAGLVAVVALERRA